MYFSNTLSLFHFPEQNCERASFLVKTLLLNIHSSYRKYTEFINFPNGQRKKKDSIKLNEKIMNAINI